MYTNELIYENINELVLVPVDFIMGFLCELLLKEMLLLTWYTHLSENWHHFKNYRLTLRTKTSIRNVMKTADTICAHIWWFLYRIMLLIAKTVCVFYGDSYSLGK